MVVLITHMVLAQTWTVSLEPEFPGMPLITDNFLFGSLQCCSKNDGVTIPFLSVIRLTDILLQCRSVLTIVFFIGTLYRGCLMYPRTNLCIPSNLCLCL